ncbi:MAG: hypothetical protein ACR2IP_05370 [Solirubrobacteraceae bacterium]
MPGAISDQQGRALLLQIGKPKASIIAKLGHPAAVGGPVGPGKGGSSCSYYLMVGRPHSDEWRVCFAGGKLASASTASTG